MPLVLRVIVSLYVAGSCLALVREAVMLPSGIRYAHDTHGFRGADWGWFAIGVLAVFVRIALLWPWDAARYGHAYLAMQRRRRRALKILREPPTTFDAEGHPVLLVGSPTPPPRCEDPLHERGPCPRCLEPHYCDGCAQCDDCMFQAPWANNKEPSGPFRYYPTFPLEGPLPRCGFCGGSPIHTRFCSVTALAVHRSTDTLDHHRAYARRDPTPNPGKESRS